MKWNFDDSVEAMLTGIVAFIPNLLGALLILVIGFFVAKLLEKGTDAVLEKARFDKAVSRGGVRDALARTGTQLDPSSLLARLVFWVVFLVVILMAANALGLTAVAEMFEQLVTYIPNVIVAVLILVLAMMIGEFVKDLILASFGDAEGAATLARVAKGAVIVLAVFMALDQLQVAEAIVTTAFTLLLGAAALAAGLAFGLGNRDLAAEYTRRWVERGKSKADELRR
ncbi:MAG: mechanosensitive ion channel [Gemmatimonadetes bacterium]|nr:mechanosensitive ion channel [Gemmatimonadota bacterium]